MMGIRRNNLALGLISFIVTLLSACSSGDYSVSSAGYTGVLTQATITAENSEAIAESVMDGASGSGAAANTTSGQSKDDEQLIGAARSIRSAIMRSDRSQNTKHVSGAAAVTSYTTTETSDCGGTVDYSFSYDDVSGEFTGSFVFANYVDCNDKSRLNGDMSLSGTLNVNTYDIPNMTAKYTALTYTGGGESMTMTGNMSFTALSSNSYKATMNMDFRDENTNETFRVENYIATATEYSTYVDVDLSGKFYHPEHGYVTMTTSTTLRIVYPDANPSSGVIELTGAGNTKITATMLTNDTYKLEIDTNGDSTVDVTKNCTWSTNTCI